ncbi:MAG: hypothetical protein PUJ25_03370 [Lachnospiraceae bacterium]|nr:hypothetical protein [Lachnospiraceae bacterium]MDD7664618.1 hypothetical protein [Lachnospiraceae bacterium]
MYGIFSSDYTNKYNVSINHAVIEIAKNVKIDKKDVEDWILVDFDTEKDKTKVGTFNWVNDNELTIG